MRYLIGLAALGAAALLTAQSGGDRATARAGLQVATSEGPLDVASVVFSISAGIHPSGELSFAGEGHSRDGGLSTASSVRYPHLVVVMRTIQAAEIRGNKLDVSGTGVFNNDEVTIEARAQDGGPNGRGDKFEIVCRSAGGVELYSAKGSVSSGDIAIKGAH